MDLTYLLQEGDSDQFKIGHGHVSSRLSSIQTGNPEQVTLVAAFPGGRDLEGYLHRAFEDRRIRLEWFRFPDRTTAVHMVFAKAEEWRELRVKHPTLRPDMLAKLAAKAAA